MNKRPGLRKRLALELFRSVAMHPASIVEVTAMFRPSILTCRSKIS